MTPATKTECPDRPQDACLTASVSPQGNDVHRRTSNNWRRVRVLRAPFREEFATRWVVDATQCQARRR